MFLFLSINTLYMLFVNTFEKLFYHQLFHRAAIQFLDGFFEEHQNIQRPCLLPQEGVCCHACATAVVQDMNHLVIESH